MIPFTPQRLGSSVGGCWRLMPRTIHLSITGMEDNQVYLVLGQLVERHLCVANKNVHVRWTWFRINATSNMRPPSRLSRKGLHHIRMHLRDKVGMNLMVVDQIGGEHIMTIRTWWWNAISECRAGGIKGLLINRNGCSCPARHPRSLII